MHGRGNVCQIIQSLVVTVTLNSAFKFWRFCFLNRNVMKNYKLCLVLWLFDTFDWPQATNFPIYVDFISSCRTSRRTRGKVVGLTLPKHRQWGIPRNRTVLVTTFRVPLRTTLAKIITTQSEWLLLTNQEESALERQPMDSHIRYPGNSPEVLW